MPEPFSLSIPNLEYRSTSHRVVSEGALGLEDPNMDGVLDIYDLGVVITHLITKISGKAGNGQGGPRGSRARKPPD